MFSQDNSKISSLEVALGGNGVAATLNAEVQAAQLQILQSLCAELQRRLQPVPSRERCSSNHAHEGATFGCEGLNPGRDRASQSHAHMQGMSLSS